MPACLHPRCAAARENYFRDGFSRHDFVILEKADGEERYLGIMGNSGNPDFQKINKLPVNNIVFVLEMKYFKGNSVKIIIAIDVENLVFHRLVFWHDFYTFMLLLKKMMNNTAKIVILVLIVGTVALSCRKFEEFPDVPAIAYNDFVVLMNTQTGIAKRGVLVFSYTDGDGDLGLDKGDTLPPYDKNSEYYYNLIIRYFEKQNGAFVEVPLLSWNSDSSCYDTLTFNSRFPVLTPESGNQTIKGIFEDTLFIYNPLSEFDTIKFKASIFDRALNKSNEIETGEIVRVQ